ncbi:MAG TPA: sugar phosphate nucleotidyltransferase [candidate division Zixibacteria bacterium]|nr:sugar phosphate nucleotidyltransferase [candidate division Zixibacteria bacterium]
MTAATEITAVVLAGGQGSRLKPLTADIPKPLVPVGGRPIIQLLLTRLKRCGVGRVHLAVNHLSHLIRESVGNGEKLGLEIHYSEEPEPLSTVAPLKLIPDLPEHFLVVNGDILTDLDFVEFYRSHLESDALVSVAAHEREDFVDYGVLETDASNRLIGFKEKPTYRLTVSMGVYVFSRSVLKYVPDSGPFGFDDLMYQALKKNLPISVYPYRGYWLDIGRIEDYERAQEEFSHISSFFD